MKPHLFVRTLMALALLFGVAVTSAQVPANLTAEQIDELGGAELIEAAQREGRVVIYSALTQSLLDQLAQHFMRTFPGIEVETVRHGGGQLYEVIAAEARSNQLRADVIEQSSWALMADLQQQFEVLTPYTTPSDEYYDPLFPEYHGTLITPRTQLHLMAYNTALVQADEVPRTWDDLLNPAFDGRRSVVTATGGGCAEALWYMLGQTKGPEYFQAVADTNPVISDANGLMIQALARGETLITTMLDAVALTQIGQGAPVAIVYPEEGVAACSHASGVARQAANPNAARLWYNWTVSELGQRVWTDEIGGYSLRRGMPLPEGVDQVTIYEPDLQWLVDNRDEFVTTWARQFNYTP
jgi:iron(III) transport system substrate-binding protein